MEYTECIRPATRDASRLRFDSCFSWFSPERRPVLSFPRNSSITLSLCVLSISPMENPKNSIQSMRSKVRLGRGATTIYYSGAVWFTLISLSGAGNLHLYNTSATLITGWHSHFSIFCRKSHDRPRAYFTGGTPFQNVNTRHAPQTRERSDASDRTSASATTDPPRSQLLYHCVGLRSKTMQNCG